MRRFHKPQVFAVDVKFSTAVGTDITRMWRVFSDSKPSSVFGIDEPSEVSSGKSMNIGFRGQERDPIFVDEVVRPTGVTGRISSARRQSCRYTRPFLGIERIVLLWLWSHLPPSSILKQVVLGFAAVADPNLVAASRLIPPLLACFSLLDSLWRLNGGQH